MTEKNLFDASPDTVELKGVVSGVTRLSKSAKMLILIIISGLLALIIFSIYSIDGTADSTTAMKQEQVKGKKSSFLEPSRPGEVFKGISDGQASHSLSTENPIDPNSPNAISPGVNLIPSNGVRVPAPASGAPQVSAASVQPLTIEQQAIARSKQEREQRREQALTADIGVEGSFNGAGESTIGQGSAPNSLTQAMLAANPSGQTRMPTIGMQQQDDPNKQIRKENFLKEAENQPDKSYLKEVKQLPIGKYEIKAGWMIPAVLETGINSDLPGQVCARVRENVYDSRTGKYLLIPQGTKTCGTYDSQIAMGQSRLLLVWNRLIFEDGSSLNLQGMPGADQAGYGGFDGKVDNHYTKIFGSALLMTIISAGAQLSQTQQSGGTNAAPSAGQTMAGALGQQLGQVGTTMVQRNLQIQSTIKQAPGYRFNILVTRDIVFPGEYGL